MTTRASGADAVNLGVNVDGRRDIPAAADHVGVLVDHADVGGGELLPPQSPRVDAACRATIGSSDRRAAR